MTLKNTLRIVFYTCLATYLAAYIIPLKFSPKDERIEQAIDLFLQAEGMNRSDFRIKLLSYSIEPELGHKDKGTIIGLANPLLLHIKFNQEYINTAGKLQVTALVIHELFHTIKWRGHDDEVDPETGCYINIMSTYSQDTWCNALVLINYLGLNF